MAPVILRPHLIAMKLVAGRDQDIGDIGVVDDALIEVPIEKRRAVREADLLPKQISKKKPRRSRS